MKAASTLKWLFSLTEVFLKNAPIATVLVVLLTLCSQVAMTLATLLPLKVVMLLGTEGIPRFFPEALLAYDRNNLVLVLVVLSFFAYIANVFFTRISENMTEKGVENLVNKTKKIILFENQDKFASTVYTKYTIALAGLIFFLLIMITFALLYPSVAILTVVFLLFSYLTTYLLYITATKVESKIDSNPNQVCTSISNIGFLLIFLYIVIDFLYLTPPNFIVALVTIILGRLMLVRLSFTASYLLTLKRDDTKINALFFHNQVFYASPGRPNESIWDLLNIDSMNDWLPALLHELDTNQSYNNLSAEWQQTQLKNILVLKIQADDKTFLVKFFGERLSSQALHESTLMLDADSNTFPSPSFLFTTKVGNYHCHLFDITGFDFLSSKEAFKSRNQIQKQLLSIQPSEDLIERYSRSKAFLWDRINQDMIDRLTLVFKEDTDIIQSFENALPKIKSILESLPLCFVNPKLNNSSILKNTKNRIVSFDWTSWSIEPVGTGLDINQNTIESFNELIKTSAKQRNELNQFSISHYLIAALCSTIEQSFEKQQYTDILELLPKMLKQIQTSSS